MTKITAEEIDGTWWTTVDGKPEYKYGPGKIGMAKAVHQAGKLRSMNPSEQKRLIPVIELIFGFIFVFIGSIIQSVFVVGPPLFVITLLIMVGGMLLGARLADDNAKRGKK